MSSGSNGRSAGRRLSNHDRQVVGLGKTVAIRWRAARCRPTRSSNCASPSPRQCLHRSGLHRTATRPAPDRPRTALRRRLPNGRYEPGTWGDGRTSPPVPVRLRTGCRGGVKTGESLSYGHAGVPDVRESFLQLRVKGRVANTGIAALPPGGGARHRVRRDLQAPGRADTGRWCRRCTSSSRPYPPRQRRETAARVRHLQAPQSRRVQRMLGLPNESGAWLGNHGALCREVHLARMRPGGQQDSRITKRANVALREQRHRQAQ